MRLLTLLTALLPAALLLPNANPAPRAQVPAENAQAAAQALLQTLVSHETGASPYRGYYRYMQEERSDRTGGHLWVERVAETRIGTVRFLVTEDGKPITPEFERQVRSGLAWDLAHPDLFATRSAEDRQDEERRTEIMFRLLPVGFLFDPPAESAATITLHYRPNPAYQPQGIEERVMHAMSGQVVIDRAAVRLRELDGHTDAEVGLGLGPLAVVKAGSNFRTTREHEVGLDWKMETLHSQIEARALGIKDLGRNSDIRRWNYEKLPDGTTLADAVRLVEQP